MRFLPAGLVLAMVLALAVLPAAARAQPDVEPGAWVRAYAPDLDHSWLRGTVVKVDSTALLLRIPTTADTMRVPLVSIQRLEVNRGRGRSTLVGAIAGGTLGALFGALLIRPGGADVGCVTSCGGPDGGGFLVGGALGTIAGALLGSQIRSGPERWRAVRLPDR